MTLGLDELKRVAEAMASDDQSVIWNIGDTGQAVLALIQRVQDAEAERDRLRDASDVLDTVAHVWALLWTISADGHTRAGAALQKARRKLRLYTLRCRLCGLNSPRDPICAAPSLKDHTNEA